ncbi:ribonuclease Z [Candidatus Woesearchaeota archaeon]|nr:ribonuclease Z [Candidatus Woesearchaeota archaeon]
MELTVLGTSSMIPTKERNVSGYFLAFEKEGILLDCGEGTQRQMNHAGIRRTRVTRVLITHWHGDHVSGLIGLLQTIGNEEPTTKLEVHGPQETKKRMQHLLQSCVFENKVQLEIYEHDPNWMREICEGKSVHVGKMVVKPEQVTFVENGKKFVYIPDTTLNKFIPMLAKDADVMLIESTYAADLPEKAEEYMHLTANDAAMMAQQANVKRLVLTHFSQRYKEVSQIQSDASTIFPETVCAYDFMKIKV